MVDLVDTLSRREYYNRRRSQLELERESFITHYKELSEYIQPRLGRFFTTDRNRGTKKHRTIINSKATQALRTATSGMLAGTMSPTRPWFALETQDPEMMERPEVREWLWQVELIMRAIFSESNFYGMASSMLSELLLFGTGAMSHMDDFEDVARFYTHTAGSYMIAQNDRFQVDTFLREFQWTAAQIAKAFGIDNVSQSVKTAIDQGDYENWFDVLHLIEPNDDFRPSSPLARNMRYKSVYWEKGLSKEGADPGDPEFLEVRGFNEFPIYSPRWDVTGEDIYGTNCPGMTALGDIKQLQLQEKRKAQGIDKMVNPPLTGPASIMNVPIDALPGGATLYDAGAGDHRLQPLYTVNPRLQELRMDIDAVERRIDQAFFVDLFLAISNIEGIQPRNQLDLIQRNEERLLQLGPVLEALQGEFLDPLIDRTFNQCVRAGILPPIPDALQGRTLQVRYISSLALAQRAVATQSIERLLGFVGAVGQVNPRAVQKFNADQSIDEFAKSIGVPPTLVVDDETVQRDREAEAQALQQQQAVEAAGQLASAASQAGAAKTDEPNALTELTGQSG